jgi:hypothetical protein
VTCKEQDFNYEAYYLLFTVQPFPREPPPTNKKLLAKKEPRDKEVPSLWERLVISLN